jgi:hypothetical protein
VKQISEKTNQSKAVRLNKIKTIKKHQPNPIRILHPRKGNPLLEFVAI